MVLLLSTLMLGSCMPTIPYRETKITETLGYDLLTIEFDDRRSIAER
jgi:hypothetical protein